MAKKGLGKGLGALIASNGTEPRYELVPLDRIVPNPMQPRKRFNEADLEELAASILEHGVVQPVVVRPAGGGYELVVGERRWRACQKAGLSAIPAIIKDASDPESLEVALIENLHREDLNGIEEANAYLQLMEEFDLTQEELSQKVGKSRSAVANSLRLLQLPLEVQAAVVAEEISAGHARALLGLQGDAFQMALLSRIIEEGLSVRQVEELVRKRLLAMAEGGAVETRREKPQVMDELAQRIAARLDVRVKVFRGKRKGKIVIEYRNDKELARLLKDLGVE
jgi:ParB family transcriptional regulator, chromosome partitioning protein